MQAYRDDKAHDPARKVGRETFAPPSLSDAAAPFGSAATWDLNMAQNQLGNTGFKRVMDSMAEAREQNIPNPPAAGWPTVGEAEEKGMSAFRPAANIANWGWGSDHAPFALFNRSKAEGNFRKMVQKNKDKGK
jgi:hypothetical protein